MNFDKVDRSPRRHDLVYVTSKGWREALSNRADLALDALVSHWVDNGWPLVARRATVSDGQDVPLGLPLPLLAGRRCVNIAMPEREIVSVASPPRIDRVSRTAPPGWQHTLLRLSSVAARYSVEARVSGSLAWQAITGMRYLTSDSDLDVLWYVHPETDLQSLTFDLSGIEAGAPMRLDGELIREDGAAVNWREFHDAAPEVLLKSFDGVGLLAPKVSAAGGWPA